MDLSRLFPDETGHTLVEVLVALALLAGVLFPVGRVFGEMLARDRAGLKQAALGAAADMMEHTLAGCDYTPLQVQSGKLTVKRTIERKGNLVNIKVQVYSKKQTKQIIKLETIRLD